MIDELWVVTTARKQQEGERQRDEKQQQNLRYFHLISHIHTINTLTSRFESYCDCKKCNHKDQEQIHDCCYFFVFSFVVVDKSDTTRNSYVQRRQ